MMKTHLFLDDYRNPSDVTWVDIPRGMQWHIVRSYAEAVAWVEDYGFPGVVSFDHDLADAHYLGDFSKEETGYTFAQYLITRDMDKHDMPDDFTFYVHSMNPTGKVNIESILYRYLKFKRDK